MSPYTPQALSLRRLVRPALWGVFLVALALPAVGCLKFRHQAKIDIPQMDTVNEQFKYAFERDEEYRRIPAAMANHKTQAAVTIAAYQKVIDVFPNELLQVGRARLGIAMVRTEEGDIQRALPIFEDLIKNDTDDEVVQIDAMFTLAGILDRLKRFDEAKAYYRTIVDKYTGHPNPSFAEMANRSRYFLYQVRTR